MTAQLVSTQTFAESPVPPVSTHPFCTFGPFVADRVKGLLWKGQALVPLPHKSWEVLSLLLDRPGEVVKRQEIFDVVWQDAVVEDNTLARHVSNIRKALGDYAGQNAHIATVSGYGYRFVHPVVFC